MFPESVYRNVGQYASDDLTELTRAARLADVNLHVPGHNYGVVEYLYQSAMHIPARFVCMQSMKPELVGAPRDFPTVTRYHPGGLQFCLSREISTSL